MPSKPEPGDNTECRAFGVIPKNNVLPLANVLRGNCVNLRKMHTEEVVLTVPISGGEKSAQLRLSRPLPDKEQPAAPPTRWLVQHEGIPVRGKEAAALPAAIREITETQCTSPNLKDFWVNLGAKHEYTLEKSGNTYIIIHDGYELQVDVVQITTHPGDSTTAKRVHKADKYVLDLRVRVPSGTHAAACQAISSFAATLSSLVTLQPAAVPVT